MGDPWYVYIIETKKGLLYTGITNNLVRRYKEHSGEKQGRKGAKFFHFDSPKKIVYLEEVENRSSATKKEILIKKMTKVKKQGLIRDFYSRSRKLGEKTGVAHFFTMDIT